MQPIPATVADYPVIAADILRSVERSTERSSVLALHGDLGAGKTTFAQAVAKELGVVEPVNSPTFVIQKIYTTTDSRWLNLVHMDAYRIEDESELQPLRLAELWADPTALVVIEWPERIVEHIPANAFHIRLTTLDESTRLVEPFTP